MLRTYQPKKLQRKKEHGFQRPQGPRPQKSEGQSKAQLLIPLEQQV